MEGEGSFMKRLLIAIFTLVIMTVLPFSAFAAGEEIQSTPTYFNIIEKSPNSTDSQAATLAKPKVGGYGTIKCYAQLVGYGLAGCDWTLNLTKKDEAIHKFDVYITLYDSKNKVISTTPISKKLLGTNYPTYRDQIDYEGLPAGSYTATVHGTVEGRYAIYAVAPVKSASFKVPH